MKCKIVQPLSIRKLCTATSGLKFLIIFVDETSDNDNDEVEDFYDEEEEDEQPRYEEKEIHFDDIIKR